MKAAGLRRSIPMWPYTNYPTAFLHTVASPIDADNVLPLNPQPYDYIIIGGGTAGCVVASRLSEDPGCSVLLVERGDVGESWFSKVPLLSLDHRPASSPVCKWTTSSQAVLQAGTIDALAMVSGKVLGGCSRINAMLYTRSIPGEYNARAQACRKGRSWDDVIPCFTKSEECLTYRDHDLRGSRGPWQNQCFPKNCSNIISKTIEACPALGITFVEEANRPDAPATHVTRLDMTIDAHCYRTSTFKGFLPRKTVHGRTEHLKICTSAVVRAIHLENTADAPAATGVWLVPEGTRDGRQYFARARREIIPCSGAIGSPQTLLLSGIGPASHLHDLDIHMVKELPGIGASFQDHIGVPLVFRCPLHDSLDCLMTSPLTALREAFKYLYSGNSLFAFPAQQSAIFVQSRLLDDDSCMAVADHSDVDGHDPSNVPDLELMPLPLCASDKVSDLHGEGAFIILVALLKPLSAGSVRLQSTDPQDRPSCDMGSFQNPHDMAVIRKGVKLALRLAEEIRASGCPLREMLVPQSRNADDLDKFVLKNAMSTFHYASSCRMAPEAEGGVVDDELRVHGVRNLRVCDASIFPTIPATHLQAPVVMVAEKCADIIKSMRTTST